MEALRRTLLLLVTNILLLAPQTVDCGKEVVNDCYEIDCPFCDGDELTLEQKYEELLVKALIDEDNLLADGYITEEVYKLQCEPFEEALYHLESASEEEILEGYKGILNYFLNEMSEDEASGMEIDEGFLQYILEEMEEYDVEF